MTQSPLGDPASGRNPAWPALPAPPTASETRATIGLVLCIVPLGVTGLVGLVLCLMVLSKRDDPRNGGRGKAVAGLLVLGIYLVLTVVGVLLALLVSALSAESRDTGVPPDADSGPVTVPLDELVVGDCLRDELPESAYPILVVPCEQPHHGEIVGSFVLPRGPWPGERKVKEIAQAGCDARADRRARSDVKAVLDLYYFTPVEEYWPTDRQVQCVLEGTRPRTGSVADASS